MSEPARADEPIGLPSDQDASGRTLGDEELGLLERAIRSGTLTSTKGTFTAELERAFAGRLGSHHGYACASGTAAIHAALAAIDPEPGEEVVTTPITDMGAITPILYQGAVPVFADVDPRTGNLTADTIEAALSERTRAIVVTHLFGNPAAMAPILKLAAAHGLPVIEDAAQAFGATWRGRAAGTLGTLGCFSLQQGKHVTCGEGGLVVTDDPDLARRVFLFINKAWGYGDPSPDHYFLALNARMSELQGAVALAQLAKLDQGVAQRQAMATRLSAALEGLAGLGTPHVEPDAASSFWRYPLLVGESLGGPGALASSLKACGIPSAPRYIQKPAFECAVIRDQRTFGSSRFPFTLARPEALDYRRARYPGTHAFLGRVLVLPWNERLTERHVDHLAQTIRAAHQQLGRETAA